MEETALLALHWASLRKTHHAAARCLNKKVYNIYAYAALSLVLICQQISTEAFSAVPVAAGISPDPSIVWRARAS